MNTLQIILNLAQVATGFAAILSIIFTIYVYIKQKLDAQLTVAKNVSSWNIDATENQLKDCNDFVSTYNKPTINNSNNTNNITMNNNPFPVYNTIVVFVPNSIEDSNSLSKNFKNYQFCYRETLIPGKSTTSFFDDHSAGMGHLVPEIYFTDNNNIQWHRSKNGVLKKENYVDKAVKSGIILKHL